MTNRLTIALLIMTVLYPLASSAQDPDQTPNPTVMKAVDAALPASLQYTSADAGVQKDEPATCAAVFNRRADGTPDLVAAGYSQKHTGIAMLRYDAGTAKVLDLVTDQHLWLAAGTCDASIEDLANPEQPDSRLARTVHISFGGQDWFLTWDGRRLINITPPYYEFGPDAAPNSAIATGQVVDIDGRGPMQIAGNNGDYDNFTQDDGIMATGTLTLFRYNGTMYAPAEKLQFLRRAETPPSDWNEDMNGSWQDFNRASIDMHHSPAPSYQMTIVNGDREGHHRVRSAKITINGQTVVVPSQVNDDVDRFTETIQLQKQNSINIDVQGPPHSYLYVVVR